MLATKGKHAEHKQAHFIPRLSLLQGDTTTQICKPSTRNLMSLPCSLVVCHRVHAYPLAVQVSAGHASEGWRQPQAQPQGQGRDGARCADRQLFHNAKEGRDMSVAEYYLVEYDCRQASGVSLVLQVRLCPIRTCQPGCSTICSSSDHRRSMGSAPESGDAPVHQVLAGLTQQWHNGPRTCLTGTWHVEAASSAPQTFPQLHAQQPSYADLSITCAHVIMLSQADSASAALHRHWHLLAACLAAMLTSILVGCPTVNS